MLCPEQPTALTVSSTRLKQRWSLQKQQQIRLAEIIPIMEIRIITIPEITMAILETTITVITTEVQRSRMIPTQMLRLIMPMAVIQ